MPHALVVEGGGMKAAYASGVLSGFESAGHRPFDAVYGTSAGGAMAAWFSAGQARFAEGTWDYAADPRILSYGRALRRRGPLLDHDALLQVVYVEEHPLDVAAVQQAPWPVIVTAADADSGEVRYVDIRQGDVLDWIKATGRLPFGAGPPVVIHGRRYVDGGVLDPVPVARAISDGYDQLTVVLNNPPGYQKRDSALAGRALARRYPALREGLLEHERRKQAAHRLAETPPAGVTVDLLRPAGKTGLHRLSRDLEKIRAVIAQGRSDGAAHARIVQNRA